ncbi:MAG: peptidoglycan-binding domain-containing protein [Myxococcota bacterium]
MVGLLQQRLTELGFDTPVDEDFGPGTRGQVEAYQRWAGLDVDGAVGQNTWAMLWHQSPSAVGERMLVHDGAVEYLERIGFNETVANNPDYDDLAILEAQHASQLLVDLGFPDLENAITPELLKAMWLRESVLDHEVRNRNGRGLGQITQTGFRGMWDGDYLRMTDLPREEVRELEGSGGWLSLARVHSGEWPSEYSQAFDYFDQNYDVAALNASLSTVWLVAQLVQNADERSPTREALVDYNGSRHKQVYARTVLRLRNGYVPRVTSGPNPS